MNLVICNLTQITTQCNLYFPITIQITNYKNYHASCNQPRIGNSFIISYTIKSNFLEEYRQILAPIAVALDRLQGEKTCYYAEFIPAILQVNRQLIVLQTTIFRHCTPLLTAIISGFQRRFDHFINLRPDPDVNNAIGNCDSSVFQTALAFCTASRSTKPFTEYASNSSKKHCSICRNA